MAAKKSGLTILTLADLERCYRIQTAIDRADDGVKALLGPRGVAICELLRQAYESSIEIMRKGARPALMRAAAGMYAERKLPVEFWNRLMDLAGVPADQGGSQQEGGSGNE